MVLTEIATDETWSLPHLKCPKNTPHISSQEGKNNKQSSQKTILPHTMCREYDRRKLLIRCLLKPTEERPTKTVGWNQSPRLQPKSAPCPSLNKDVNEASNPHGEQDKTSRPTQTHHHCQDCHLPKAPSQPPPPKITRVPPPQTDQRDRDWIVAHVGKVGTTHCEYLI
jgi:hypothetical protein